MEHVPGWGPGWAFVEQVCPGLCVLGLSSLLFGGFSGGWLAICLYLVQ